MSARTPDRGAERCPICRGGGPRDVVARLESSWVTMGERSPMAGYACLVFGRHAVELHDLSADEGAALMRDMQRLARAVQRATGAAKLNYEIHGNTLPHLHVHYFPRHAGDAFEGRPIDPRSVRVPVYAPGEFDALRARVVQALDLEELPVRPRDDVGAARGRAAPPDTPGAASGAGGPGMDGRPR